MSHDQIQLPEPDGYVVDTEHGEMFWPFPDLHEARAFCEVDEMPEPIFRASTVRRLIAEAVAAEREACALACDEAKAKSRNHLFRSGLSIAAGVIRARGDQT